MANFKRKRSRSNSSGNSVHWLNTPSWWNIVFHTRPRRHKTRMMEHEVVKGCDPDGLLWPVEKKPHSYYW